MYFTTSAAVLVLLVGVATVVLGAYLKIQQSVYSHAMLLLGLFIAFAGSILLALSLYKKNKR